ncbi:Membrane fusion protein (MFP) family protein [Gammaproteobacteria bacterium]
MKDIKKAPQPPVTGKTETTFEGELVLPMDTKYPARIGLWVLIIGFGGFLLWADLAPLDEGVPTMGMVAIDTKRKAVQHQIGGIVQQVFVKEGQFVKANEPLLRLDDAVTLATYEAVRQHYLTLRAAEGRLQAEQSDQKRITFHPDLIKLSNDPYIQQTINNQEQLFQSRRNSLQAELQGFQESIRGQEASIHGYEGVLSARKAQQGYLQEDLKGMRDLVKEGYAPRNKQLELDRMVAEAMASIADTQGNIQRARSAIAELKMRSILRTQEYHKEVDTQLADVRREVQADAEKYKATSNELSRTIIRSPAEGQVVGLVVQTVGGVISPGQKLMDIVPGNEPLLLETKVPPHVIDRVKTGALVDVRFSSFAHSPQLVVQGKIVSISNDLLAEPNQPPYYLARVAITSEGMKELGNRQLQPGMPVEAIIKTGERSVLTYLLHPLLKRMAASMKEE